MMIRDHDMFDQYTTWHKSSERLHVTRFLFHTYIVSYTNGWTVVGPTDFSRDVQGFFKHSLITIGYHRIQCFEEGDNRTSLTPLPYSCENPIQLSDLENISNHEILALVDKFPEVFHTNK
jgi:hypothetical protein